jgi:hypothetical protein
VPFYRVTLFSHYAPGNVPRPGETWSLMCEVCETAYRPAPADVPAAVVAGLRAIRFIAAGDEVLTVFHRRLEYGYPTPFLGRDALVKTVDDALKPLRLFSRGRFGAWKYEVSNQDHSLMQGVEVINRLNELQQLGIQVKTLDGLIDTSALGKLAPLVVGLLTGLSEVERSLIQERSRESVEFRRKNGGNLGGRPKTSSKKETLVVRLRGEGESYRSIQEQTGLALATITRIIKEQ